MESLNQKNWILIKGARANNLQNINLTLQHNKFIVITGISGSGKSSLAFDTLFAAGQRAYIESLSTYIRQFLGKMEKPPVDCIKGLRPAISVKQYPNTKNHTAIIGTTTEIYDYLKLLYARIGKIFSPVSKKEIKRYYISDIVEEVYTFPENTRLFISIPLKNNSDRTLQRELEIFLQKGFNRIIVSGEILFIEEIIRNPPKSPIRILIDRNKVINTEENRFRLNDSLETAMMEGNGECIVDFFFKEGRIVQKSYSSRLEMDGIQFEEPHTNLFNFNSPYGACENCEGSGFVFDFDIDKVIPNKNFSIKQGTIAAWKGETMSKRWLKPLIENAHHFDFPIYKPYNQLTQYQKEILWNGNGYFRGLKAFFTFLERNLEKIQYRIMHSRLRDKRTCPDCRGTRIRKEASYIKIGGKSLADLLLEPIEKLVIFFEKLPICGKEKIISKYLLTEIKERLVCIKNVGLGYLTLNRTTSSLSGGEYRRIKLMFSLGTKLIGAMYILDEPSVGLHPKDIQNLISILKYLNQIGNTIIVVEHEEEIIRAADCIVDIGPDAGILGGKVVFQGNMKDIKYQKEGYTARFLNGLDKIPIPKSRRKWEKSIQIINAKKHNLKDIQCTLPLHTITGITGVSGSGKSTLIKEVLYTEFLNVLTQRKKDSPKLRGDINILSKIELIDQSPIGRSSRSNPVTYMKAYDLIRQLFAQQTLSKRRKYTASTFSFNLEGGRCEECRGEGKVKVEMQFMANMYLVCDICKGNRFKKEVLEITYQKKI